MKIASSAVGEEFHVVCVTDSGTIFHCIRHENKVWDPWETLHPGGIFKDVCCAAIGLALNVIAVTDAGLCMHRIREKDGRWTEFSQLPHQPMFEN